LQVVSVTAARRSESSVWRKQLPLDHIRLGALTLSNHTVCVFCAAERPLGLSKWLAVPFLFSAAVYGLIGVAGVVTGSFSAVALSALVSGASVAVGVATSSTVRWSAGWQRTWLRWPYLVALLAGGVLVAGYEVPAVACALVGLPTVLVLVAQCLNTPRTAS
jgi:hypothetical protein